MSVFVPDGGDMVTLGQETGGQGLKSEHMTAGVDRVQDEDGKGGAGAGEEGEEGENDAKGHLIRVICTVCVK